MPKEQRTFTKEFKLEAVQLAQKSGKSQAQIARDLGIADSTLHNWCKELAEAGAPLIRTCLRSGAAGEVPVPMSISPSPSGEGMGVGESGETAPSLSRR